MAVKKLDLMDLVCKRKDLDKLIKELVLSEKCEFIDSFLEINEGEFKIDISVDHADEILGMEDIVPIEGNKEIEQMFEDMDRMLKIMEYQPKIQRSFMVNNDGFLVLKEKISRLCDEYMASADEIKKMNESIARLDSLNYFKKLADLEIDFRQLLDLKHFTVKLGYLEHDRAKKISMNYENIKAMVLHVGADRDLELYLIISPKSMDLEMERIFRSVSFKELKIDRDYLGTPESITRQVNEDKCSLERRLVQLKEKSGREIIEGHATIDALYSKLKMEEYIDKIRRKAAETKNFAYLSAWIPENEKREFETIFSKFEQVNVSLKSPEEVSSHILVPTKLQNNRFFQPFELLVNMYGVPSHDEIDPTIFFGIAYIFLFGAMFGDFGQGFVIVLAGIFLKKRIDRNFSGILTRIGMGSMIFGILYDSFFGYENVISKVMPLPYFLRPMENINLVLILAVVVGVILLVISYIYSIVNKLKGGNLEEGLFGKNGINGAVLFLMIIWIAYGVVSGQGTVPLAIPAGVIALNVMLLLVKQPLTNKILGIDPLFEAAKSTYFVESGFNIVEIFLSIVSNCISFVRVGAFALNHVGLFLAFHTMASIVGGLAGNLTMFVIGNLVILCLEGLIVFIQGLRLFYYELFSKYYTGEGVLFAPEKIQEII
jgi:V/A-type H+-transporting ATPase subunit I